MVPGLIAEVGSSPQSLIVDGPPSGSVQTPRALFAGTLLPRVRLLLLYRYAWALG